MKRIALALVCAAALWPAAANAQFVPVNTAGGTFPGSPNYPTHVIVMIQENRTPDNLFQTMAPFGADIQNFGINSSNAVVPLVSGPLNAPGDLGHAHNDFVVDYNGGLNNGWDIDNAGNGAYNFVQASDVVPYTNAAHTYSFFDETTQTGQSPSFPAHLYLAAASAGYPLSLQRNLPSITGTGCQAALTSGQTTQAIDESNLNQGPFGTVLDSTVPLRASSCANITTVFDLLNSHGKSWKYYRDADDFAYWDIPGIFAQFYFSPYYLTNESIPETNILTDIAAGNLANVSYVIPSKENSDHPGVDTGSGPAWVQSVVNAVGASPQLWYNTTILIVWDDWGGEYDHVKPQPPQGRANDPGQFGYRVPLIAISPYVIPHCISHKRRDYSAIITFIETTQGLGQLGGTLQMDGYNGGPPGLDDCFNWTGAPRPFTSI